MNSVFNLASHTLRTMSDEELLTWLHTEGLANMPPIIRTLVEHLEDVQDDVVVAQEETKDATDALRDFDRATTEALRELDKELGGYASDLGKVSDAILESQGKILVEGDLLVDSDELDDECPDDQLVIPRKELGAIRAQIDSIAYAISNLETGDYFPDRPSI